MEHRRVEASGLLGRECHPLRPRKLGRTLHLGSLPEKGKWVRLEVTRRKSASKPGTVINGWAFTQFDGTVYWDKAGIVTQTPQGERTFDTPAPGWRETADRRRQSAASNCSRSSSSTPTQAHGGTDEASCELISSSTSRTKTRATLEPLLQANDRRRRRRSTRRSRSNMPATLV